MVNAQNIIWTKHFMPPMDLDQEERLRKLHRLLANGEISEDAFKELSQEFKQPELPQSEELDEPLPSRINKNRLPLIYSLAAITLIILAGTIWYSLRSTQKDYLLTDDEATPEIILSRTEEALKREPDDFTLWHNKGRALDKLGRLEEALAAYDTALNLNQNSELWHDKGRVLLKLERFDDALLSFDDAIQDDPEFGEAWAGKGEALSGKAGNIIGINTDIREEALIAYEMATIFNPDDAQVWYNKGKVLDNLHKQDAAIAAYEKALELNPNLPEAWFYMGHILLLHDNYEDALNAADEALRLNSNYGQAWLLKGLVLSISGRHEEAAPFIEKARSLGIDI